MYYVATLNNPNIRYSGYLWNEINLPIEDYKHIEDAIEVSCIFNSITSSLTFIVRSYEN